MASEHDKYLTLHCNFIGIEKKTKTMTEKQIKKQISKIRKLLSPNGSIKDSFEEMLLLFEMMLEYMEQKDLDKDS